MNKSVNMPSSLAVVHYFIIKVYDKRGGLGELIELLRWDGLRFDLRMKYDWYFKYRAALLQVKYPKYVIDIFFGNEPAKGKTLDELKQSQRKAKQSNITKKKNKLKLFQQEFEAYKIWYSELFPIEEHSEFKRYRVSIELAKNKIKALEQELEVI